MNHSDKRYEQGKALLAEGRNQEACLILEQLTKDMPKFKKAWEKLAISYMNLSKPEKAAGCYEEILIRYPKDAFALYQKSVLEEKTDQLDKALDSIEKALKFEPNNAEFLYAKGYVLYRRKKLNDAIKWFDRALSVDPYLFNAADYKCLCLMTLGIYDELIICCTEYVDRFKDFIDHAASHENERGGELFGKEYSEIRKEDIWHLYSYLSFSYMKLGAFGQAEDILLKELDYDYEKSRVYYYLGLVQNALGKYEQAAESYSLSLENEPDFTAAEINLGLALAKAADSESHRADGKADKAEELYRRSLAVLECVLENEPEHMSVLCEAGKINLILGNKENADCLFNDILRLDPSYVPVYEYLAKMRFADEKYEEALSLLSDAQTKDPFNYEILNLTGVIYSKKGDNEFALKCLTRAEMLDPANPKAHYNKALIFMKEQNYESAAESLSGITETAAIENGISYEKVLNFYKTALENSGKKEEA
jgi:Flp pilus assembly protein TadD, contains TPR repeats